MTSNNMENAYSKPLGLRGFIAALREEKERKHIEELKKLDELNKNARAELIAEMARGFLIRWENELKRLQRWTENEDKINWDSKEDKAYLIGSQIEQCAKIITKSHDLADSLELRGVLIALEEKVDIKLQEITGKKTCVEAITVLASQRRLKLINDYLEQLEDAVNRLSIN